jgi:hypothetical protein
MMWIDVNDRLPDREKSVLAKNNYGDVGMAEISMLGNWNADSSFYDITALDDSGLDTSIDGKVTHWMEIPK